MWHLLVDNHFSMMWAVDEPMENQDRESIGPHPLKLGVIDLDTEYVDFGEMDLITKAYHKQTF